MTFFSRECHNETILCRGKKIFNLPLPIGQDSRLGIHPFFPVCVAPRQASWSSNPEMWSVFFSVWVPVRDDYGKEIPLWERVFQALQGPYQCYYFCAYRTIERELQNFRTTAESWGVPGSRYSTSSPLTCLWLILGKVLVWMGQRIDDIFLRWCS